MSRYSGGQDNEFWLEAWNGGHYTVERMSRPAISIDHLLVGVVGGMQPDKLARSFKGDLDGMTARVLFSWPPEPAYQPLAHDIAELEPEIVNALTRLVELKADGDDASDAEFAPRTVSLSSLAIDRFEQFRQFVHAGKRGLDAASESGGPRCQRTFCVLRAHFASSIGHSLEDQSRQQLMIPTWKPPCGLCWTTFGRTRARACARSD
jgi:hypothetical protein